MCVLEINNQLQDGVGLLNAANDNTLGFQLNQSQDTSISSIASCTVCQLVRIKFHLIVNTLQLQYK